jgi:hypothetical protein
VEAYDGRAKGSNTAVTFTLQRQQPRTTGDYSAWITRALANVLPWRVGLAARIARAWRWHDKQGPHPHSDERWARERELAADLKLHARMKGGQAAHRLPGALGLRAKAVLHGLARLINDGDWWKPRTLVDRKTGEVRETLYLPEDTWSAQTAFHWGIERLAILARAAGGMTEKVTPPSSRKEPSTPSGGWKAASRSWDQAVEAARLREKYGGVQPELPAQG